MNISGHLARQIAEWLKRVTPAGHAEEDALASTIHALEAHAHAERQAAARKIMEQR